MPFTDKEIFWKCWLWSLISGTIVAVLFWILSGIGNLFHGPYGGTIFVDLLLVLSIAGSYAGAGYVGWRLVNKYHPSKLLLYRKAYVKYSLISFVILAIIVYSPLSILALLWSFIAPYCVLLALSVIRKTMALEKPVKTRKRAVKRRRQTEA